MLKAREQDKLSIQLLEKRLVEAQTKKNELEKELNAEKRSKMKEEHAAARALAAAQSSKLVLYMRSRRSVYLTPHNRCQFKK